MKTSTIIITIINFIIGLIAGYFGSEYVFGNAPISSAYCAIGLLILSLLLAYGNMKMIQKGIWVLAFCLFGTAQAQQTHKQIHEKGITGKFALSDGSQLSPAYVTSESRDTKKLIPFKFESGMGFKLVMQDAYYSDSITPCMDSVRTDSTLGLALFIDTFFILKSAICLRIRHAARHSYGQNWFYDDPATESYLSLVDGQWIQDLDDRLFLIFVPRKQFQDGKKKGVNEK